ncbi:MAG: hypothetical protein ACRETL_02635 [Gammaproteobacteria bacterium]
MLKFQQIILAVAGLFLALCVCQMALASYAIPDENIGNGTIQSVNYVNHTVTVAGHVYSISPKAFYGNSSVKGIEDLQAGMRIQFTANGPVTDSASRVINVIVLPPGSQ